MPGPRIALVAAEHSGDLLGASLMRALKQLYPDAVFDGVGGAAMAAEGLRSRIPMERLGVMGLVEVVAHLPGLMRERRVLADAWIGEPPDVFIGVDAPDFNLGLAKRLRAAGIATVQYVSPTFWAWRQGRIETLRRSCDLVLCLFPFEAEVLSDQGVNAAYVGHPLADEFSLQPDQDAARRALGLPEDRVLIGLLPGSRRREVAALSGPFLETALWLSRQRRDLAFAVPLVSPDIAVQFEDIRQRVAPDLPLYRFEGRSRDVLAAVDVVLTASGTATLESLLSRKPMVVGYRLHGLTWFLARHLRLVKSRWVAMANILAGEELAPEFLQGKCDAAHLGPAVLAWLDDPERARAVRIRYGEIHEDLRQGSGAQATSAVAGLIEARGR
jgi:lipid-A-disaccharide synthase